MNQGFPPPGQSVSQPGYGALPSGSSTVVPPTYVVRAESNGMAIAALVLGIIGALFGIIPILFFIALPLGVLALVFGAVGRGKRRRVHRKMAWSGLILGIIAIALGIAGVAIVNNAVDDLEDCLTAISEDFDDGGNRSDRACD